MVFNLSLRAKILLTIISLTLSTLMFVTIIFITNNISQLRVLFPFVFDTIHQGNLLNAAFATNNFNLAQDTLGNLKANPYILKTDLYFYKDFAQAEPGPQIKNTAGIDNGITMLLGSGLQFEKPMLFPHKNTFEIALPIRQDNKTVGITYVEANPPNNIDVNSSIEIILLIAIIATFVAMRLEAIIAKPLLALVEAMKSVTIQNDYSVRVKKINNDEVGTLVDTFNSMLEKIQANEKLQVASQEQIKKLAYYDALTGLPNRDFFRKLLQQTLADAKRNNKLIAILYCGLDDFKLVNDKLGHDVGDILLQRMVQRLQFCLRESDTVGYMGDMSFQDLVQETNIARLSGDEFVITLHNINSMEDAEVVAQRIIDTCLQPYDVDDQKITLTVSIGIAAYPLHGMEYENLIKSADIAMYSAKKKSKACYEVFKSDMHSIIMQRIDLENDLRNALHRNEFVLFYQPKLQLSSNKVIGLEALIRWNHPQRGSIPPDEFIGLAESSGLIVEIGAWVLNMACRQCQALHDLGFSNMHMAVNLSGRQFYDPYLTATIQKALTDAKLEARYLEVELTESMIMLNDVTTLKTLHDLKEIGVKISVDDFGTGYSSLRYLSRYPIDTVKIDKSFVSHLLENKNNAIITRAIIDLAHNLNLSVIAEGVETKGQLDYLQQHHCDEIQGFLISKPLPDFELINFLNITRAVVYV